MSLAVEHAADDRSGIMEATDEQLAEQVTTVVRNRLGHGTGSGRVHPERPPAAGGQ